MSGGVHICTNWHPALNVNKKKNCFKCSQKKTYFTEFYSISKHKHLWKRFVCLPKSLTSKLQANSEPTNFCHFFMADCQYELMLWCSFWTFPSATVTFMYQQNHVSGYDDNV